MYRNNMKLNFGIIGCGRIAQRHAEHILKTTGTNLTAVCDIKKIKADAFGNKYEADIYYSVNELLKNSNIDIVSICSPNGLHAEHTINSLNAGLHVLCEKPMAIQLMTAGK